MFPGPAALLIPPWENPDVERLRTLPQSFPNDPPAAFAFFPPLWLRQKRQRADPPPPPPLLDPELFLQEPSGGSFRGSGTVGRGPRSRLGGSRRLAFRKCSAPSPRGRKELRGRTGGDGRFRTELNFTGGAREARGVRGSEREEMEGKKNPALAAGGLLRYTNRTEGKRPRFGPDSAPKQPAGGAPALLF